MFKIYFHGAIIFDKIIYRNKQTRTYTILLKINIFV